MDLRVLEEKEMGLRKGTWSFEEDSLLINYISIHGEGRWNHLARNAGLKRTGRSCRMRWKNYLRPNLRRGDFTAQEQLRIMELHCSYGNRWSRIAEFLPGRRDNEIKNYWRTRVHKQARLLKFDVNSMQFRDFIRNVWLPLLSQQIQAQNFDDDHMLDISSEQGLETSNEPQERQIDDWAGPMESNHAFSMMDNYDGGEFFLGLDSPMDQTWHSV